MGDVGKFFLGAALVVGSFFVPGLAGIAGTSLGLFVGGTMLSVGVGLVTQSIFSPSGMGSRQQAIEYNQASNMASLPTIYGKAKVGLRIVDIRVDPASTDNKQLYIVGALCHGSQDGNGIAGIDEIYFDNKLVVRANGTVVSPYNGKLTVTKYLGTDAQTVDSTLNTKFPNQWPSTSRGRGVAYVVLKLTFDKEVYLGGIPNVTCVVRGCRVADPRSGLSYAYSTNPALALRDYLSSTRYGGGASAGELDDTAISAEANYCDQTSLVPRDNTPMVIQGATAASPIVITTDESHGLSTGDVVNIYQNGATAVGLTGLVGSFVVTVSDTNTFSLNGSSGTGTYAENSASWKPNRPISAATAATPISVTLTSHGYATNDIVDVVQDGVTVPGLTGLVGRWTITVTGANTFTLNGSVGSGSYNANSCSVSKQYAAKLFETNGWLDGGQTVEENFRQLLSSCRAYPIYEGGKFRWLTRRAKAATTFALTEDNIVGDFAYSPGGIRDSFNKAIVGFLNPRKGWASDEVRWPREGASNTYLTDDNNFEVQRLMELPMTTARHTAEQIGMVALRESRACLAIELTAKEAALELQVGDVVPVTHSSPGWSAKQFWVMAVRMLPDATVRLSLMEYDANAYTLDTQAQFAWTPDTNLPDPSSCRPPTGLTLLSDSTTALQGSDGTWLRRIKVTWTAPTPEPFLDGYFLQYRKTADPNWINLAPPLVGDTEVYIDNVEDGVQYTVQLQAYNTLGVRSAWASATITPSIPGTPPASPAKNLCRNGDAEYKKLVNWFGTPAGFDRTSADAPPSGQWCWEVSSGSVQALSDDYIPMDIEGAYEVSVWLRQVVVGTSGFHYVGVSCYDSQQRKINVEHCYAPNGLVAPTTLAANVSPGQTTVTLVDASGFPDESGGSFNTYVALNTADDGSDIPNFNTLRYTSKTGNVLNLTSPVPAGVSATSGQKVRFHRSSSTYTYTAVNGLSVLSAPSTWTKYRGILSGVSALGSNPSATEFRPGTAYVRAMLFLNNSSVGSNTVRVDDYQLVRLDTALWRGSYLGSVDADLLAQHMGLEAASLIRNGAGMEGALNTAAPGWTFAAGQNLTVASDQYKTGDRSLRITHASAGQSNSYQDVTVEDGALYLLSGWLKTSGPGNTGALTGVDSALQSGISSINIHESLNYGVTSTSVPQLALPCDNVARDWTYCECIFQVTASTPGGTGVLRLKASHGFAGNASGSLWLDGLKLVKLPPGLWSLFDSAGKLSSGVLQVGTDGTARRLVKGKQTGYTHHKGAVTFPTAFAQPPAVRFSGGLTHEPQSMWGSLTAVDGKVITAATTATPISCTVTGHGLSTGAKVSIFQTGATAPGLNIVGLWTVTVVNANTFTLDGSAGSGTYNASSCNVSTGVTALDSAKPERDYVVANNLTGSGFTTRALLHQRLNITLTNRSANGAGRTAVTTVGSTDSVDLGASMPAYDDRYAVTVLAHMEAQGKYTSGIAELIVAIDTNDGSGWVERTQISFELPYDTASLASDDADSGATLTVTGMGSNDDIRARAVSYTESALVLSSDWSMGISSSSGITWQTSASNDQYASKTPHGLDDIYWEAEGYL